MNPSHRLVSLVIVVFDLLLFAATYQIIVRVHTLNATNLPEASVPTSQLTSTDTPIPSAILRIEPGSTETPPPATALVLTDPAPIAQRETSSPTWTMSSTPPPTVMLATPTVPIAQRETSSPTWTMSSIPNQATSSTPPPSPTDRATPTLPPTSTDTPSPTPTVTQLAPTSVPTRSVTPSASPINVLGILASLTPSASPIIPTKTLAPRTVGRPSTLQAVPVKPVAPTPLPTYSSEGEGCAPRGRPVQGILTRYFSRYHPGVDLAVDIGTAVRATHSGMVIFAGWRWDGYGNLVILQNGRFITYYAHNHALLVAFGQIVHAGDVIALSGSTGWSSGPHVHYETHIDNAPVDPMTFDARQLRSC